MSMNKQAGNMYGWVTHTWNPIRGKCPHECKYCYMKRFKVGELRLEEKELKTNLGKGNVIFIGSSVDMWAEDVPDEWIMTVLEICNRYQDNMYLFQSKNPKRFREFVPYIPKASILGTTIETNRENNISKAPIPKERAEALHGLGVTMISIEPIMEFDLDVLVKWIKILDPEFVSIGADSQNNSLPEPSSEKVKELIEELNKFTDVKLKDNLKRIMR